MATVDVNEMPVVVETTEEQVVVEFVAGVGYATDAELAAAIAALAAVAISGSAADLLGTLADLRLSSNVPLKNAVNTFIATQTITPASGSALILTEAAGSLSTLRINSSAGVQSGILFAQVGQKTWTFYRDASNGILGWYDGTATRMQLNNGLVVGVPTGGDKGVGTLNAATGIYVNNVELGFRGIPQNSQSGNYTCVLADAGKHIYHPAGAGSGDTFTIPANASVPYEIGAVLWFVNESTDTVAIAITSDTLTHAGTGGTTGTFTLAAKDMVRAVKTTATTWMIK